MIELHDSRGVYRHPSPAEVTAAALDAAQIALFAAVEKAHVAFTEAVQRIAERKEAIAAKEAEIVAANKHLAEIRPPVTFHQLWKASFK
jgi:hypothetical protein